MLLVSPFDGNKASSSSSSIWIRKKCFTRYVPKEPQSEPQTGTSARNSLTSKVES